MIKRTNIFVAGTGTDIGKTYIAGLILKKFLRAGINAAYFKAAMSGNIRDAFTNAPVPGDAVFVKKVSGSSQPLSEMCPYVYEAAYSPHLAARLEGNPVDFDVVLRKFDELSGKYDCVIMEGSGGILCPIRLDSKTIWLEHFIKARNLDCILVADAGLGTINAVGLTAHYMMAKNIALTGIILNHFQAGNVMHEDNLKVCESITGANVIACVRDNDEEINFAGGITL
ncbi:MAG: dethiobiotin synthase [Synergistaceae bacterium]|nr:dethiobiotin synthase [Synergistaceae bacterium]